MILLRAGNHIWFNILLLIAVGCFVVLMPIIDRNLSRRLGINIEHGLSTNPDADRILLRRKLLLFGVFGIYIMMVLYLVLFSRVTSEEYRIHIAPLNDVLRAISLDESIDNLVTDLWPAGIMQLSKHIIIDQYDIMQVFLNTLLFVPLGYLLPYIFDWFKKNVFRSVVIAFLASLVIENLQLIFRRGFYDFDDLLFNTLGGLIGAVIYNRYAFMVTNPTWKKDLARYYRFRKHAWKTVLFPFSRSIDCERVVVFATVEEDIYSFYVDQLGFFLRGQHVSLESDESSLLLRLGSMYVEFLCSNDKNQTIPPQTLHIHVKNIAHVRKRLEKKGIPVSEYTQDFYTKRRKMRITGPDQISLEISE